MTRTVCNLLFSRHLSLSLVRLGLLCLSPGPVFFRAMSLVFQDVCDRSFQLRVAASALFGEPDRNDMAPMHFVCQSTSSWQQAFQKIFCWFLLQCHEGFFPGLTELCGMVVDQLDSGQVIRASSLSLEHL